jgi:anaerobic selenocysteine-containing dehydrogenase
MNRRGFLKGAAGLLSLPIVGKMASSVKSPMVREGIANVAQCCFRCTGLFLEACR